VRPGHGAAASRRYAFGVPSLFRRKPAELVAEAITDSQAETAPGESPRPKNYTPSKRELGKTTPKRKDTTIRRAPEPPPANRREAYRRMRERQRENRAEQRAGMMSGDERYLLPRDRGPERGLVRDIVDSRRTIGTWFLGGALVVLIGSMAVMPQPVRVASNLLWAVLATATVLDSLLLGRQVNKLVKERFPDTQQKMGRLYLYAAMRGITFRRMRVPKPRIALGTKP